MGGSGFEKKEIGPSDGFYNQRSTYQCNKYESSFALEPVAAAGFHSSHWWLRAFLWPRVGMVTGPFTTGSGGISHPREKKKPLFPVPVLGCYSSPFPVPIGLSELHRDPDPKIGSPTSPRLLHRHT